MIKIGTHNFTTAYPEPHDRLMIEKVMDQWMETRSVPTDYFRAICEGTFSTTDIPFGRFTSGLADLMAADPFFVAETEAGWREIDEGRCSDLSDVKRRLGDR